MMTLLVVIYHAYVLPLRLKIIAMSEMPEVKMVIGLFANVSELRMKNVPAILGRRKVTDAFEGACGERTRIFSRGTHIYIYIQGGGFAAGGTKELLCEKFRAPRFFPDGRLKVPPESNLQIPPGASPRP